MRIEKLIDSFSRYNYYRNRNVIDEEIISKNKITLILKKGNKIVLPIDVAIRKKIILNV
jgi:hypothetical protein